MAEDVSIRRLAAADLRPYKALRDDMLAAYPEAFTSDAMTERHRRADDYVPRLGLERRDGGNMLLGAWQRDELLGAIGLERDLCEKVRHVGHVVGMMVRDRAQRQGVGRALLAALIAEARGSAELEVLTLSVTDESSNAMRLYERAGFRSYGTLDKAVKVGQRYLAKAHMVLYL